MYKFPNNGYGGGTYHRVGHGNEHGDWGGTGFGDGADYGDGYGSGYGYDHGCADVTDFRSNYIYPQTLLTNT